MKGYASGKNREWIKVMWLDRGEEPSPQNIMLNGERMEVVNSFKYLGSCFSREGSWGHENVWRYEEYMELLKTESEREERVVWENCCADCEVWLLNMGYEVWGDKQGGCIWHAVSWEYVWGYMVEYDEECSGERGSVGGTEEMSKRVDRNVLKWFWHVDWMGDERLTKKVCKS